MEARIVAQFLQQKTILVLRLKQARKHFTETLFLRDPTGREVSSSGSFDKIVCLVPSITELLCSLGLRDKIVGITSFCIHPSSIRKSAKVIGGTKTPRLNRIADLKPDIVIANLEENKREDIEHIELDCSVYVSVVKTYDDNERLINDLAKIFSVHERAEVLISSIKKSRSEYIRPIDRGLSAMYFIWKRPYMSVGRDTFIHSMMCEMGLSNLMEDQTRYPALSREELLSYSPSLLLLSSEPYPFKERDEAEFRELWPSAKVLLVDGEMFSWYGSRVQYAYAYFDQLWQQIPL